MGLPGSGRAICVRCVHFTHSCINLSAPAMWEQVLRNLLEKCLAAHLIWSIPAQQQSRIWYREPSVTQHLLHRFKLKKKSKPNPNKKPTTLSKQTFTLFILEKEGKGTLLQILLTTMEVLCLKQNHQVLVLAGRCIYRNKDLATNMTRASTAGLMFTKPLLKSTTVASESWRARQNITMVFISVSLPMSRVNPKILILGHLDTCIIHTTFFIS